MAQLARIGTEFLAVPDEESTLRAVVTKATEFVPGCTSAAVTQMTRGGSVQLAAVTDSVAAESERNQLALGEGPTSTTFASGMPNVVDLRHEARWPAWVLLARGLELTAMITLMLTIGSERLGVLSLYSVDEDGFGEDAFTYANAYCTYAAVALFGARQSSRLTSAVDSRHRIGIAQGILMCRYSISKEAAFQLLRRYSNANNTKLRDVADVVFELRDLPPQHRPGTSGGSSASDPALIEQRGRRHGGAPVRRLPPEHRG